MTAAVILLVALAAHLMGLALMLGGARWLGRQRRLGRPDSRARALDRPVVLGAIAAGYIWINVVVLVGVAALTARL
jgi:hypothetical protein